MKRGAFSVLVSLGLSLPVAADDGVSNVFKGVRDRISDLGKGTASAPAAAPGRDGTTLPDTGVAGASPSAMKIKEFKTGSKLPSNWNDSHCRTLVDPFDITDSAASIGIDRGKKVVSDKVAEIFGTPKSRVDARSEIREQARQLNWLPMSTERAIGEQIHADAQGKLMRDDKRGKDAYTRARRILQDVTGHIGEPHPYTFQIYVTTESAGNAEAAPGGYIYVDEDLVSSAQAEPRARFAIAHEVSHVLQRHRTRETQMRISDSVDSVDSLMKLIGSARASPDTFMKKGLDTKRMFVRHSEEQELQADGCAVRLLDAMSGDKAELIRSINAFAEALPKPVPVEAQGKAGAEAVFAELSDGQYSRHPSTPTRIKNLNAVLSDLRAGR